MASGSSGATSPGDRGLLGVRGGAGAGAAEVPFTEDVGVAGADVPGVVVRSVPLLMTDPGATAAMVRAALELAGV